MNKTEFSMMHIESKDMLMRPYREGWIAWSMSESEGHYLAKCMIVRLLKEGVPPNAIPEYFQGRDLCVSVPGIRLIASKEAVSLKRWHRPKVYTEARFTGRLGSAVSHRADIFVAASVEGRSVIEIVDSEDKGSLDRKRNYFEKRGIKFYEVRI